MIDSTKRARPEGLDGLFRFGVKNRAFHILCRSRDPGAGLATSAQRQTAGLLELTSHNTAGIEFGRNSFEFQLSSDRPLLRKSRGEIATTRETIISRAGREAGTDIRAILGAINPQTDSESSSSPFRLGRHMAVGCHNRGKSNLVFLVTSGARFQRAHPATKSPTANLHPWPTLSHASECSR